MICNLPVLSMSQFLKLLSQFLMLKVEVYSKLLDTMPMHVTVYRTILKPHAVNFCFWVAQTHSANTTEIENSLYTRNNEHIIINDT